MYQGHNHRDDNNISGVKTNTSKYFSIFIKCKGTGNSIRLKKAKSAVADNNKYNINIFVPAIKICTLQNKYNYIYIVLSCSSTNEKVVVII